MTSNIPKKVGCFDIFFRVLQKLVGVFCAAKSKPPFRIKFGMAVDYKAIGNNKLVILG